MTDTTMPDSLVAFRLRNDLREALERKAEAEMLTMSAWLRRLVRDNVKDDADDGPSCNRSV